jgi:hypothetical protein
MNPSRITRICGMSLYSSMYGYLGCMPDSGRFNDDSRQTREEGGWVRTQQLTSGRGESFELFHSWVAPPRDCC